MQISKKLFFYLQTTDLLCKMYGILIGAPTFLPNYILNGKITGILEIKTTTTTSQSGEINTSEMSDLQLSEAGSDVRNHDVAMNQLMLTIVETICYESLIPFFTLKPQDVVDIKDKARIADKLAPFESSRAPIISIEHVQNTLRDEEEDADGAMENFLESLRKRSEEHTSELQSH